MASSGFVWFRMAGEGSTCCGKAKKAFGSRKFGEFLD
jgi:hypothetical protein